MCTIDVQKLFCNHNIVASDIKRISENPNKEVIIVNDSYVFRSSLMDMRKEQASYDRIAGLPNVPRIQFYGEYELAERYFYTILSCLPGMDYLNTVADMTQEQNKRLGISISMFLDKLHNISGTMYNIGHYTQVIPEQTISWKNGHIQYWQYMQECMQRVNLSKNARAIVNEAFIYMYSTNDVLDYQAGPVLLHNDLHPKNIIVHDGSLSGIIDWECSQFGEADFDLCHLIHWCLYPPIKGVDFKPFLESLFSATPKCMQTPNLSQRLTIYEIEHELIQLIWANGVSETERIPRLRHWIDGGVDRVMNGS